MSQSKVHQSVQELYGISAYWVFEVLNYYALTKNSYKIDSVSQFKTR